VHRRTGGVVVEQKYGETAFSTRLQAREKARVEVMGYYSVIILTPKNQTRLDYRSETMYFGEDERLMQVRFYEAVRKAQTMPAAEVVVVWHDGKQLVRVKIEH